MPTVFDTCAQYRVVPGRLGVVNSWDVAPVIGRMVDPFTPLYH